jgi:hypothetical protein
VRPALFLLPLLLLPLAACDEATLASLESGTGPEAAAAPPALPPAVAAVLPPGTPASLVFQNVDGCYLFSVEVTDPPSGFPVTDAAGNPVCEGQPVTVPAGSVPAAAIAAPADAAPADGAAG